MKILGKVVVHGCNIPGFNKKIEIYHPEDTTHSCIKGEEAFEVWYEDGSPIIIECKLNKIEGIVIQGGVLTDIKCVYNKQSNTIEPVITYDNSKEMYEELQQFTKDCVPVEDDEKTEHRMRCNVCGHIFCYTEEDLSKNIENAGLGLLTSIGSLASTLGGGSILHTHHLQGQADRYTDNIVDYSRCPSCHSNNITEIGNEEDVEQTTKTSDTDSVFEEIKQLKELLDMGVITQEEFDAKKKQLLGL